MGDLGVQVSVRSSIGPFVFPSTFTLGALWAQLLLQFCTNHFETLHMFSTWCEDVHVVWIQLLDYFLSLFPHCELSHFFASIYRQWVPLVSVTPLTVLYLLFWNFAYVFLMVWGCAYGLGIIVRTFFCHFFRIVNLVIFSPSVYRQWVPLASAVLYRLFRNFVYVFFHGMRMCMWFGYNC